MQNVRKCENDSRKIIYLELSYKINGILFSARKDLGLYCNEKQYCDYIENKFVEKGVLYEREKSLPPSFKGENPNRNKLDFLVEDKIIIETKAKRFLDKDDYYQLKRYLISMNKRLGILVNFRENHVKPRRVINSAAND